MSRVAFLLVLALVTALAGWVWFRPGAPEKRQTSSEAAAPPPAAAPAAPAPALAAEEPYTFAPASQDGIGKFFYGREIAQVMGHSALGWLERDKREMEEAPSKAIAAIDLKPTDVIADIGAGSGYYSFRISPKVPQGKVVAIDIQPEMLDFLRKKSAELKVTNVEPHLGEIDDVKLPAASLDAALMVDAYHEFSHPREMLASLHQALRPGGRIFLLEFRAEDTNVPIKALHKMTEAQARLEFEGAGFKFVSNLRPLPWQHFLIFQRP